MSYGIAIDVRDAISPYLDAIQDGFGNPKGLHEFIANEELELIRDYLLTEVATRHKTASALGATPSGHWGDPQSYTSASWDDEAATVAIRKAGIGRAVHDVDIEPGAGKQWLTIPLIAEAYNQRACRMAGLFFTQPKGKGYALLGRRTEKGVPPTWVYLLVKSVHQAQDRTLLPTQQAMVVAADIGARKYLKTLKLQAAGGPN